MAYDTDFNVAKAKQWKIDVETELSEVESLLSKTANAIQELPWEDDSIGEALVAAADKLQETWSQVGTVYKDTMDQVDQIISNFQKKIEESVADIQEFASKIKA